MQWYCHAPTVVPLPDEVRLVCQRDGLPVHCHRPARHHFNAVVGDQQLDHPVAGLTGQSGCDGENILRAAVLGQDDYTLWGQLRDCVGHRVICQDLVFQHLDLLRPIYSKTAAYGHFGRERNEFTWEQTDKADELKDLAGI